MPHDPVRDLIGRVDQGRLARDVYHLAKAPLPFRKLNYTLPGHTKCTLHEADDFIEAELRRAGWAVEKEAVQVQAFRHDASRPRAHQYSPRSPKTPGTLPTTSMAGAPAVGSRTRS